MKEPRTLLDEAGMLAIAFADASARLRRVLDDREEGQPFDERLFEAVEAVECIKSKIRALPRKYRNLALAAVAGAKRLRRPTPRETHKASRFVH